jgi:hypothetical protein
MREIFPALVALALLAACDPTKEHDYECTQTQAGQSACAQFRLTDAEAAVALNACEDPQGVNGSWHEQACASAGRTAGYCDVAASKYSLSGNDVRLYFYGIDPAAAQVACETSGYGAWVPGP